MVFAQLASVSCLQLIGQQAPETLGYQGIVMCPYWISNCLPLLASLSLPGVVDKHSSLLRLYQRALKGSIANQFRRSWWLFLKASQALYSSPILNILNFSSALLFFGTSLGPWFSSSPLGHSPDDHWQGSSFCPPQDVSPSSRTLGTLSPVSPPPSLLGESVGRSLHALWLAVDCSQAPQGFSIY